MADDKKKGELLNQLAIISDLIENVNIESKNVTINFSLKKEEYEKVNKYLKDKSGGNLNYNENTSIGIMIGEVKIVFSNDVF